MKFGHFFCDFQLKLLKYNLILLHSQIEYEFEYIKIYDGGSEYADIVENITGIHKQTTVSIPGNQMFVKYETSSNVARKGFRAFIQKIGKK